MGQTIFADHHLLYFRCLPCYLTLCDFLVLLGESHAAFELIFKRGHLLVVHSHNLGKQSALLAGETSIKLFNATLQVRL